MGGLVFTTGEAVRPNGGRARSPLSIDKDMNKNMVKQGKPNAKEGTKGHPVKNQDGGWGFVLNQTATAPAHEKKTVEGQPTGYKKEKEKK
jgi:hypothetical protein